MAEYLAPGVYVEEVSTGSKPIEGVSTTTTGLLGVTERGPVDVPVLITSFGEYRRIFGEHLDIEQFVDSTGRPHCYLSHAVDGFFTNGGKRAWLTRVLPEEATSAERNLFFRDLALGIVAETVLLRPAERGTGTAVNQPPLFVLDTSDLSVGDVVRVGSGSQAEYREIAAIAPAARHLSVHMPLNRGHAVGASVEDIGAATADTTSYAAGDFVLADDFDAGSEEISVVAGSVAADLATLAGLPGARLFQLGTGPGAEYVFVSAATPLPGGTEVRLTLETPLTRDHDVAEVVTALEIPGGTSAALAIQASGGDVLLCLDSLSGAFVNTTHLVIIDAGTSVQEVRRVGQIAELDLDREAYETYPARSIVERVTIEDDDRSVVSATTTQIQLDDATAIVSGMTLIFGANSRTVTAVDLITDTVTVAPALPAAPAVGSTVVVQPRMLTAHAAEGAVVIALDNRLGIEAGDVLRVGVSPNAEYVTVRQVNGPSSAPPDAGSLVLESALRLDHPPGTAVRSQFPPELDTTGPAPYVLLGAEPDQERILVNDGTGFAAADFVRIVTTSGNIHYHQLDAGLPVILATPLEVELTGALERSHASGEPIAERQPLLAVRALDPGSWGNRVLVSCASEADGLSTRAGVVDATPALGPGTFSTLKLTTPTGVEAGSVIELLDPTGATRIGALLKVRSVNRAAGNLVTLDSPGLDAAQMAAHAAAIGGGLQLVARSREFRLEVLLLAPPNPAVPTRNDDVADREVFRHLSMDPRHSRYVERIVGSTWTPGSPIDDLGRTLRRWDRRSEGTSQYVRVRDLATSDADRERVRLGPETLTDTLPSGLLRSARHRLGEGEPLAIAGDDSMATLSDATYRGADASEPELRTGIHTFKNVNIALAAVPGQTSIAVQQALIDHCEEQRYRFAVLDAPGPTLDTLADVQLQRQQFDSKYAALYHPWLTIPDPYPDNIAAVREFAIPPSGHVLGIYARTDIERGVHKAPANEVVRGIVGLTRDINKAEQDVLNAYPVNIDVIRDFRPNNRGIRVWGARVITSDSDYKYVNVRRLLIFLEDSIDRGLQWVVFEPNAEELWGRVRRSVTNFLTTVWRNGALEGTTPEQGFFVKCDRTTMTQTDIDNGRLICVVGVAPVKPAEFVIIRIGLWTADAKS